MEEAGSTSPGTDAPPTMDPPRTESSLPSPGPEPEPEPALPLDPLQAAPAEKEACAEFFRGRANKTPERYLRIRNHMVEQWRATRPQYLTKIRARAGLRNCGDVNAIGRVHDFLERAGVINAGASNTGAAQARARRRVAATRRDSSSSDEPSDSSDGGHGGGHVIVHGGSGGGDGDYHCPSDSSDGTPRKRRRRRTIQLAPPGEFRLVPCQVFSEATPAPFSLRVSAGALALMDLHAQLMHTEVIGLLGGHVDVDAGTVDVDVAFPCAASAATATECEMDPASEVAARRAFAAAGRRVVGWFHSHPTFAPTPSVRDIHNQRAYQALCRTADGREPFAGLIVAPTTGPSDVTAFFVVDDAIPYALPFTVAAQDAVPDALPADMERLLCTHAHLPRRADLARRVRRAHPMTALENLLLSLRSRWAPAALQPWDAVVAGRLRPLLVHHFCRSPLPEPRADSVSPLLVTHLPNQTPDDRAAA
ncbi:hypothetical protein GGF46_002092 [Coemansia sp. RSA 552]|nr:hypothetical protein GGF46_002092 [Coemansia sp. RSA 552]